VSSARLAAAVAQLEASFRSVAQQRLAGVPVLHPGLRVQALGFVVDEDVATGILLTPWFMNLVRLPLAGQPMLAPGHKAARAVGTREFEFIGGHEAALGAYEAASLFSPMFEFADQAAAVATATAVLEQLRPQAVAARRGFLFGRSALGPAA
jgi:[NiFe] hydrogenase assembly HybE family chaperone